MIVYNVMNLQHDRSLAFRVLLLSALLVCICINYSIARKKSSYEEYQPNVVKSNTLRYQRKMCIPENNAIRAKRKVCLLRPDTGPCRADVLVWYYDAKQKKCYRFFWGGCQGNGNNFPTQKECMDHCFLTTDMVTYHRPYFCSLSFDFGTCFGQYNRWGWDSISGFCKRRLYSGCGGNQNNFETKQECMATCLMKPNNTLNVREVRLTTCIPFTMPEFD